MSATEAAVFSRDLERARAAFAQAGEEDRWLAALRLSDMAIAAVLACAGRGEPPSAASRDPEFVTTEPSVRHRARVYGFDVGEFPENDALRARVCEAGVARGDPLPAELEAAIAGRVEEAFAALAPGVRHSP